ncbi:3'-5' ssDNA/RNA exonuclease TatD [Nasonia vitripennis]|uniref:Deoxyribonuclease TATDN1 n=1 Tax=Nasonia vitripennis TaxID=7425 RepID=A0A7M7HCG4_NASVI|nr:3'-5' ssDNA/RNA exonuclease TatD [Nasonia vitripennis]XP_008216147.1 3'-5' ssDNA/RNA exonuclease TatD [Nasonia vitripennis]XP_008216149.1 3'-5' ssDNA/RNA exonuclease TatD [Nasonia vitripennis]XP_032453472.1 3'-5' ssDNA/RNA exonuclease TatD [Nasonia vitripennis]XP_032453473.1 3'-5' ssDNA/RNA exonuclease TatD [Nasonia vitripennis]
MSEDASGSKMDETASAMTQCYENYVLVDVGANLTNKKYSRDLDSVIQRAKDAGVQKIMVTGASIRSSKEALRLTRIYPGNLYSTAGVHPHDAKSWEGMDTLEELESIANNPECVAIGECGLDYNRDFSEPEIQRSVFQKQVELACRLNKPLVIHERGAQEDVLKVLKSFADHLPPVLIHSFIGTAEEAQVYLDHGFYLGITGYLCKDKSDSGVRQLLEGGQVSLDRILVETDAPFMYPNTRASKLPVHVKDALTERSMTFLQRYCTFQRNEPCALPAIVEMVAAFMHKTPEEVALATAFNALKLFGLNQ